MDPFTRLAEMYKALAHPVRLQILGQLLIDGEACVCHLEANLGQRQAYISQQLAKLRQANLVGDRRDGLNIYYSVSSESIRQLLSHSLAMVGGQLTIESNTAGATLPGLTGAQQCSCPQCDPAER